MHIKYSTQKQFGCLRPSMNKYTKQGVGCGKCPDCIKKKRGAWFLRLGHELKYSHSAYFVTLTYKDSCLPRIRGKPTLNRIDLNKFLKKIRKEQDKLTEEHGTEKQKIRYFGCGEYGDNFDRPHYHLLLFNALPDIITNINRTWNLGNAQVGEITPARMMYTTKYLLKGSKYTDGRVRSFVRMSTGRPAPSGIGSEWLKKNANFIRQNKTLTVRNLNGDMQFLPRYYREYIWPDEEERKQVIKEHLKDYKHKLNKENTRLSKFYNNIDDWQWSTKQDSDRRFKKQLTKISQL